MDNEKKNGIKKVKFLSPASMEEKDMDLLKLHDFIGARVFVTVAGNRLLSGTLVASDCELNLLLDNVEETTSETRRRLGLVSVPENTIESIKLHESALNSILKRKQTLLRDIV